MPTYDVKRRSPSSALPLGELSPKVTERAFQPSSLIWSPFALSVLAALGHLSHRERQVMLARHAKGCMELRPCIYQTNWNLTVLQQLYLIGNHSHVFCVGINFCGIECLIHRYSCYASLNYIFRTNTSFYIHCQSFTQSFFIRYKRDAFHLTVLCIQLLKYGIDNTLLVHHPTKNDILVCRTFQKTIE